MNIFDAITTRRSVRTFTEQPVERELVEEMIQTASFAPSAGDARPWTCVVVDDPELMRKAADINPYGQMAADAPCGIAVCGDTRKERHAGFWVQDCSAFTQTMLLTAHALGLGSCWTGVYPVRSRVDRFSRLLELPKHVIPLSFVLLGYPARRVDTAPLRDSSDAVFYNYYGEK